MSSPYNKLRRILLLEKEQGYRNRAVIGGLGRFLIFWAKEARQEPAPPWRKVTVDQVVQVLSPYDEMPVEQRGQRIDELLSGLAEAEPVSSTEAPPPALTESPPETGTPAVEVDLKSLAETEEPETARPAPPAQPLRAPAGRANAPSLDAPITSVRGINTGMEGRLMRLGITSVRDLLYHLPRRYDDLTQLKTINRLALGDEVTIVGIVREVKASRTRSGQPLARLVLGDATGSIEARWFQPYLDRRFQVGDEIVISGRVDEYLGRLYFNAPEWEPLQREQLNTARMVPVYPLTEGVGMRWLRRVIKNALDAWTPTLPDILPRRMVEALGFPNVGTALQQMHFPDSWESLERARQRLCFDELLLLQLGILRQRRTWRSEPGRALVIPYDEINRFTQGLPFALTGAQQRAMQAILSDMEQPVPMSRLLQGDVGSGKTVVAVAALLAAARNGLQAAIMAPTSILAEQHHRTISALLGAFPDLRCELLTGGLGELEKQSVRNRLAEGSSQVVVGTHALIQDTVQFASLGLVVVDEQHRFGVEQRGALRAKRAGFQPHLLAMSATPIPRTLAFTIYGDLDLTVLDELPPGRQEIVTAVRDKASRERIYSFIGAQVKQGRQAFVICPLVEESEGIDAKAAITEFERLQKGIFPLLRLGLLHGRMTPDEKEQVMAAFKGGQTDILVSTAVVEVGIDIPNATVMLIEGAERFGLAQLHQFRGRVGRGEHKSYCILLSDDTTEESVKRLQMMEETNDGFLLAEKDLEMRGPGDLIGIRQHGLPNLRVASLSDIRILERARAEALAIFERDADLSQPEHQLLARDVERLWGAADHVQMEVTP